jgi:hypothetical protein
MALNPSTLSTSAPARSIGGKAQTRGSVGRDSGFVQIAIGLTVVKSRKRLLTTVTICKGGATVRSKYERASDKGHLDLEMTTRWLSPISEQSDVA